MDRTWRTIIVACIAGLAGLQAQDEKTAPPPRPTVARDKVKGSIHHGAGKFEWERVQGTVKVLDATTLELTDGTRLDLGIVAPALEQRATIDGALYPCGKEAAEFLRKVIGDRPVTCFRNDDDAAWIGYVGDTNLEQAMVIGGWALANHSSLHPAEIIAHEGKRGMWRGQFVNPRDWRKGKRLPAEK
jgi:endonuclease YncB( thermonuclease family)